MTGQQTGLFGGPLYTAYKALTAVRRARYFSQSLGIPVVPVFWLAADDHDLAEVDHTVLPDRDGRPVTFRYQMPAGGATPRLSRLVFDQDIAPWSEDVLARLPDGPGRDEVLAALRDAYAPGCSWAEAFARLVTRWFGRFGLVLVTPDDADLKRLMEPIFAREIADPDSSRRVLDERDRVVEAAGYSPQVARVPGATLLFVDDEAGSRRRLDLAGDGFTWTGREAPLPRGDMLGLLERAPERFSANALLRPVSADSVFPTLAHIVGPGEIAYMAQARGLYERHGVAMPILLPRARFTIVSEQIDRLMAEEGLLIEDCFQPLDRLVGALAARAADRDFRAFVDGCRSDLDAAYEKLGHAVAEKLPGIGNAVASARMKTQALATRLERKLQRELRRVERTRAGRLESVVNALYPLDAPQERVLPVLPFLARYGSGFLDSVLDVISAENADHCALWPAG